MKKSVNVSLLQIFGVGWAKSRLITIKLGFSSFYYIWQLNNYNFRRLTQLLKFLVISDVRIKRIYESNIKRKVDIRSYSGVRLALHLPVRGQRTRTNAQTCRNLKHFISNESNLNKI